MSSKLVVISCLVWMLLLLLLLAANSPAAASLCQLGNVASNYPHQALPNQQIQVNTTISGSCASDGEDYFSARVDLVDKLSNSTISSNSTPIGYNATDFSVTVENGVVTPSMNVTWPLEIDVYVTESGGVVGKYLFTTSNATIQVGVMPVPEFHSEPGLVIAIMVLAATLMIRRELSNPRRI